MTASVGHQSEVRVRDFGEKRCPIGSGMTKRQAGRKGMTGQA